MGSTSHLTPGEFSLRFNHFLARVVEAQGGRATARWAEAHMPSARKKDYWGKLLSGRQAMTTEDIALIAGWLQVSPFDFVRAVNQDDLELAGVSGRPHDEPHHITADEEAALRKSDHGLAAREDDAK